MEDISIEIWKPVLGFEGYEASNQGRIRSLNYRGHKGTVRILKPQINKYGYAHLQLRKDGVISDKLVHRLVYEAFNGPIPEGLQCNHVNEVILDNSLENLNIMTCKENNNWGTRNERAAHSKGIAVDKFDLNGNYICTYWSIIEAERQNNIAFGSIGKVCLGQRCHNTAGGFIWRYHEEIPH